MQGYLNIANLDDYYSADNKAEFLAEKESLKVEELEQTLTHEEAVAKYDELKEAGTDLSAYVNPRLTKSILKNC